MFYLFIFRSISENSDDLIKRDCAGFPCMYTHMAEKAGRASLFRALARIIDDCAADPRCNPGTDFVYTVVGGRCGLYCTDPWTVNPDQIAQYLYH